jgi:class 3 adenylate cyclase
MGSPRQALKSRLTASFDGATLQGCDRSCSLPFSSARPARAARPRRVREFDGQLVEFTWDGMFAAFDGPGRGIACVRRLSKNLEGLGLRIRAGLHAGEIERRGDQVAGVAVHIAARVMVVAGPGEILVTRTIRDLVVGSDLEMRDRGSHPFKGVDGDWQVFAVGDEASAGERSPAITQLLLRPAPLATIPTE